MSDEAQIERGRKYKALLVDGLSLRRVASRFRVHHSQVTKDIGAFIEEQDRLTRIAQRWTPEETAKMREEHRSKVRADAVAGDFNDPTLRIYWTDGARVQEALAGKLSIDELCVLFAALEREAIAANSRRSSWWMQRAQLIEEIIIARTPAVSP